jgi:hypothetical protein
VSAVIASVNVHLVMPKTWSGRRESNPRMQLGKQAACQWIQELSCKTATNRAHNYQRLRSKKQNSQSTSLATGVRTGLGSIGWHDDAADFRKSRQ